MVCAAQKRYEIDQEKLLYPAPGPKPKDLSFIKPYIDFFKKVYNKMNAEYYLPVSIKVYEQIVNQFTNKVLLRLRNTKDIVPEIKYWGAGLLVKKLKSPTDTFTNFFPPQEAKEYKTDVLGYALGIGISGEMRSKGYYIKKVELRSDSYSKGIRPGDIITKIDGKDTRKLPENELQAALYPELGKQVNLEVFFAKDKIFKTVAVDVVEFFKETLSSIPTGIPGLYYIKINQFNKKTGDDFIMVLNHYMRLGMKDLIIDLRGNKGGPPLVARQIASIFLPPHSELFYFQRKNRPKASLFTLPSNLKFDGRIAILIDRGSGSASELFSGTLREYNRAILIGERSAGKTFLKSMFHFDDSSMLVLVTSLAYLPDGSTYNSEGLKPDFIASGKEDIFTFIFQCLESYYEG